MDKSNNVGFQVGELARMIKRSIDEHIAQLDIEEVTGVQARILGYVYGNSKKGNVYQRDIEKDFHVRRSSVAETLRLMENKGFIVRECVSHDARLKRIVLTPKAMAIQEQVAKIIEEVENSIVAGLSRGEMMVFLETLDKIKANLREGHDERSS